MVLDGLRGYLQLASGLTDVTRERALAAARAVATQGAAGVNAVVPAPVTTQVSTLTEDLLAASKANRALLLHLIQAEIERSVARLGLVSAHELDAADPAGQGAGEAGRRARGGAGPVVHGSQGRQHPGEEGNGQEVGEEARKKTTKKTTAKKSTADEERRADRGPPLSCREHDPDDGDHADDSDALCADDHDRRVRHVTEWHHEDEADPTDHDDVVDQVDHDRPRRTRSTRADHDATRSYSADARDPRIAAAVARLDGLGDQPPVEHVEVYEEVHRVLQESLADANHSTDRTDGQPGGSQP